jgi:hypothetical protein
MRNVLTILLAFTAQISMGQIRMYCSSQTLMFTEIAGDFHILTNTHESGHIGIETVGPIKVAITPSLEIGPDQRGYWKGTICPAFIPEAGTKVEATITTVTTTYYRQPGRLQGTDTTAEGDVRTFLQSMMCAENHIHQCDGWHTSVSKVSKRSLEVELISIEVALPESIDCEAGLLIPRANKIFPAEIGKLHWKFPWGEFEGAHPPPQPFLPAYHGEPVQLILDIEGVRYKSQSRISGLPCMCDCKLLPVKEICREYCLSDTENVANIEANATE